MQPVFAYLLKMGLCSGILLGYYWVALRNARFHQWNRFYLLAAMLLSVLLPFFSFPIIAKEEPTVVVTMVSALPWNSVARSAAGFVWNLNNVLLLLGCLVSLLLLLQLFRSVSRVVFMYRRHEHAYLNDVSVVLTEEKTAPFSFFKWLFWRNDIDPDSENGQRMLQHELTHISEKHSADKLFTELLLILFWVNPFFWIIRRELYSIHEFLADQKAIEKHDGAAFAAMILQAVNPNCPPALCNPFFSSQLKRRLIMITTSHAPKYSYLRRISGLLLMITTALVLILTIEKVNAQKVPTPPKAPVPAAKAKPVPAPDADAVVLADSILSVRISDNNDTCMVTYKMKDGRKIKMQLSEAEKNGYPYIVPPPPPPVPGVAPVAPVPAVPGVAPVPPIPPSRDKQASGEKVNLVEIAEAPSAERPLIIYAGIEISAEQMKQIDPKNIQSVDVLKGENAVKAYGEKGKNGVVRISAKNMESTHPLAEQPTQLQANEIRVTGYKSIKNPPLYIIDDKKSSEAEMKKLDPQNIEKMNVLKGQSAIDKYGPDAADGAIEITSKRPDPSVVLAKVDVMPSFPGGATGWSSYLQHSLKYPKKAQKAGTQGAAVIEFVVAPDGNISNLAIVKDPGNGLGDEALRVIKQGPKWIPAEQNGTPVTVKTIQTITFRLE